MSCHCWSNLLASFENLNIPVCLEATKFQHFILEIWLDFILPGYPSFIIFHGYYNNIIINYNWLTAETSRSALLGNTLMIMILLALLKVWQKVDCVPLASGTNCLLCFFLVLILVLRSWVILFYIDLFFLKLLFLLMFVPVSCCRTAFCLFVDLALF